jgi:hypothetical protein
MEVHHADIHQKKIKDFLLEGLMIFIAVTMGFFAESLREKIDNKEREIHYIGSLINDLEKDSLYLMNTIRDNKMKISGLDSLLSIDSEELKSPAARKSLYLYSMKYITFYSGFISSEATMMQLKNSGGLQVIKKKHIADSIAIYDQAMRSISLAQTPYAKAIDDATESMTEILFFRIELNGFGNKQIPLVTNNSEKLEVFFNKVSLERGWSQNYVNNLTDILPTTLRLINLLRKEYNI